MSSKAFSSSESPQVIPILVGQSTGGASGGPWSATASVTLVKDGQLNILVDCGSPWEEQKLLNGELNSLSILRFLKSAISALKKHNVKPNQVQYLICTHGHIDHIGNLNLFREAVIILDSEFAYKPGLYGKHVDYLYVFQQMICLKNCYFRAKGLL